MFPVRHVLKSSLHKVEQNIGSLFLRFTRNSGFQLRIKGSTQFLTHRCFVVNHDITLGVIVVKVYQILIHLCLYFHSTCRRSQTLFKFIHGESGNTLYIQAYQILSIGKVLTIGINPHRTSRCRFKHIILITAYSKIRCTVNSTGRCNHQLQLVVNLGKAYLIPGFIQKKHLQEYNIIRISGTV